MGLITCEKCRAKIASVHKSCPFCGFEFPIQTKAEGDDSGIKGRELFEKKESLIDKMPHRAIILVGGLVGLIILIALFSDSSQNSARKFASGTTNKTVFRSELAKPEDVRQAEKFLNELPSACRESSAIAHHDGTVSLSFRCVSGTKSRSGEIRIKDGIVTQIH